MNDKLRTVLAIFVGLIIGSLVNGQIVNLSDIIIPLPENIKPENFDPNNIEQLREMAKQLPFQNHIMPFLAHALGTLIAAFIACKLTINYKPLCAIIIGIFFLLGGIAVNYMVQGHTWFIIADLVLAYFPMAFLGKMLAGHRTWFAKRKSIL